MKTLFKSLLVLFLHFFTSCQPKEKMDIWKVYLLGGQSNMDGYGHNSELPDSLNEKIENSMIFDGLPE